MKLGILAGLAFAAMAIAPAAFAQRDVVVITGSRIDRDGGSLPVISIRVPADFVVFLLEVETATRSEDERARELETAFATLVDRVRRAQGFTLEAGDAYTAIPIDTVTAREIIEPDDEDPMRSEIRLSLTVAVKPGDTFDKIRIRAEELIKGARLPGRVEIVIGADQFMGVNDPKKHRETLLRQIAADTELLQSLFGRGPTGPVSIALDGFEGRVQSRPVAPLEMELYLDYSLSLVQAPRP